MEINRKRVARRLVSGLVAGAVALGGLAISGSSVSAKTPVTGSSLTATDGRVGGADRYETATKAADEFLSRAFPTTMSSWKNVVVASGNNYPDALAASGLAGALNAPIILLPSDGSMPESVYEWALSRRVQVQSNSILGSPFTVYVVGGESAVPAAGVDAMMAVLTKNDATPAVSKRIAGDTRAETAQLVALEKNAAGATLVMSPAKPVFLVNQNSFADALSIAPYAFNSASPVLLTSSTSLSAEAQAVLTSYYLLGGSNIVILGGTSAVSTAVEEALVTMGFAYANISRISGADRYATSVAIAKWVIDNSDNFNGSQVTFASGETFADGLAGAPVTGFGAATEGRVLLLVQSSALPASTQAYIAKLSASTFPSNMFVLGGTAAVSNDVPTAVAAAATAINGTSSLTCIENEDATTVTLTVPGNVSGADGADGSTATTEGKTVGDRNSLFNNSQITVNGDAQAAGVEEGTYSALTGSTTFSMNVAAGSLTAGKVIAWAGLTEVQNTVLKRAITGSSCTVADDAVPPSVSIDARVPGAGAEAGVFYVTFSEPVDTDSVTGADFTSTHTDADGFAVTAINDPGTGYATIFKVTQFNDADGDHVIEDAEAAVALAADKKLTFAKDGATDRSKNTGPSAAKDKTISAVLDLDATKPVLTAAATCVPVDQTILVNEAGGSLTMTATAFGPLGVDGNLYSFKVTNVRGTLIPKVVVDDTAKTIVLTADLAYSTGNDVIKSMANDGIVGWSFATGDDTAPMGASEANLTAGLYTTSGSTAGTQDCDITITASENIQATSATVAVVVSGVQLVGDAALTASSGAANVSYDVDTINPPLPLTAGTVTLTLSAGWKDVAGNTSLTSLAF